jgi:hypothetical protein
MSRAHALAVMALVPSAPRRPRRSTPAAISTTRSAASLSLYQQLAVVLQQLIEKRLQEKALT